MSIFSSALAAGGVKDGKRKKVVHELELYNTGYYLGMFMNSFAVFQECGLWVLTDANLVKDDIDGVYDGIDPVQFWRNRRYLVDFHDSSQVVSPVSKAFPETLDLARPNMVTYKVLALYTFCLIFNLKEILIFGVSYCLLDSVSRIYQEFEVTVPDSITSWVATAFVISEDLGLGLTTAPVEVIEPHLKQRFPEEHLLCKTFDDFFLQVKVIIEKSDDFDILMASNEINATGHQQTVLVPSEDGATVLFPVRPTHLGEIPVTVTAVSPAASDAVTQRLLVKAEGIEKSYSQSILLDLTDSRQQTSLKTLSFSFPPHTVSGSERVQITAIGDILGSSINGLASLIRMPYGCGEQNMINFAPNIYVLDYLTKKKQLTENLREKALSFMRQGK
ncbi:CD109 antigen [Camelus dromedarius]|nr:CD109 antigen [Camelus dromedarius]